MTQAQVDQAFVMLERAVFQRAQIRPLLGDAWKRRASITVADAPDVVLAQHLDATLVTAAAVCQASLNRLWPVAPEP